MTEDEVEVLYTNGRGETRRRVIRPLAGSLRFEATEWHKRQWIFDAEVVKASSVPGVPALVGTFALSGIHEVKAASL